MKYHGHEFKLVDLPGTYSLTSYTIEEIVTRRCIEEGEVDVIINVVDASSLERNLYLTLQLLELKKPVILALILATGINMLLKSTGYVSLSEYDVNIPAIIILCLLAGIYFFIRRKWKQKLSAISLILLSAVLGIVVSVIAEHIR